MKYFHINLSKHLLTYILTPSIVFCSLNCGYQKPEEAIAKTPIPAPMLNKMSEDLFGFAVDEEESKLVKSKIGKNQSFESFLAAHKIETSQIKNLIRGAAACLDLSNVSAGKPVTFVKDKENNKVQYFVYQKNKTERVVFDLRDSLVNVYEECQEQKIVTREIAIQLNGSIFSSLDQCKLHPELASKLAEVLQYSFDFFKIKKGDIFRVIFDEKIVNNQPVGIGEIHAVSFIHDGKKYEAYRFEKDGKLYDEKGNTLRQAFLKAPLKFTRISSGFDPNRFHPILKVYKAHNGIDYAAPTGTPIMTIGDGVIEEIGYGGGNGNYIKVKHNKTYTTQYLHMSKFAEGMKKGKRVTQGDVIGYVGSTGLATGPHLCFRFWKDGTQVNPATHISQVKAEPIPAKDKASYLEYVEEMQQRMDKAKLFTGKALASS